MGAGSLANRRRQSVPRTGMIASVWSRGDPCMKRSPRGRRLVRLAALLALAVACSAGAADPAKVLHVASPDIDTLDPQSYTDDPSFQVLMAIFEAALRVGLPRVARRSSRPDGGGGRSRSPTRQDLDDADEEGHPLHATILRSAASRASSPPRTTSIRTSAGWIPTGAAAGRRSSTDLLVGARAVVDAARKIAASSTTTRRSRACARSTAIRCSSAQRGQLSERARRAGLRRRVRARGGRGGRRRTCARARWGPGLSD